MAKQIITVYELLQKINDLVTKYHIVRDIDCTIGTINREFYGKIGLTICEGDPNIAEIDRETFRINASTEQ